MDLTVWVTFSIQKNVFHILTAVGILGLTEPQHAGKNGRQVTDFTCSFPKVAPTTDWLCTHKNPVDYKAVKRNPSWEKQSVAALGRSGTAL